MKKFYNEPEISIVTISAEDIMETSAVVLDDEVAIDASVWF